MCAIRVYQCHVVRFSVSGYTDVESPLQGFLSVDEPPIQKIEEMWTLTAPVDAFQLLARRLTTS